MTKKEKTLEKLLAKPKDFTWEELLKVLKGFGYKQDNKGRTSGSRVCFIHDEYAPINLHRPHPKQILKRYQIEEVINLLRQEKLI